MNQPNLPESVLAFVLHAEVLDIFDASDGELRLLLSLPRQIRGFELDAPRVVASLVRGVRPTRLHFSPSPVLAATPRAIGVREALRVASRELPARMTEDARLFDRLNLASAAPYAC